MIISYFDEGDLIRAQKVCRIGLKKHPEHVPGLYLLAVIAIRDAQLVKAEVLLEQVLNLDPHHLEAAEFLVAIQERLKRSPKILASSYQRLLIANPGNQTAKARLERIDAERNLVLKVKEKLRSRDLDEADKELPDEPKPAAAAMGADANWETDIRQVTSEIEEARDAGLISDEDASSLLETETDIDTLAAETGAAPIEDELLDTASEALIGDMTSEMGEFVDELPEQKEEPAAKEGAEFSAFDDRDFGKRPLLEEETGEPEEILESVDPSIQLVGVDTDMPGGSEQADESDLDMPPQEQEPLNIDPKLATFTLATIYKVQGLFVEALVVLNMLEEKGADHERIDDERDAIRKIMEEGDA